MSVVKFQVSWLTKSGKRNVRVFTEQSEATTLFCKKILQRAKIQKIEPKVNDSK